MENFKLEEKERYSLEEFDDIDWELAIVDNELGKSLTFEEIKNLLNQQDKENKQIANLHDELNRRYCSQQDELIIVKEENKSLKKIVNHYKGTTLGAFADEIRQLKQSQIQFTINVLEDIMSHCRNGISDYWSLHYVCTIIENKIKSLKNFDNKQSEGSK